LERKKFWVRADIKENALKVFKALNMKIPSKINRGRKIRVIMSKGLYNVVAQTAKKCILLIINKLKITSDKLGN